MLSTSPAACAVIGRSRCHVLCSSGDAHAALLWRSDPHGRAQALSLWENHGRDRCCGQRDRHRALDWRGGAFDQSESEASTPPLGVCMHTTPHAAAPGRLTMPQPPMQPPQASSLGCWKLLDTHDYAAIRLISLKEQGKSKAKLGLTVPDKWTSLNITSQGEQENSAISQPGPSAAWWRCRHPPCHFLLPNPCMHAPPRNRRRCEGEQDCRGGRVDKHDRAWQREHWDRPSWAGGSQHA
jgi:hypothetical protein